MRLSLWQFVISGGSVATVRQVNPHLQMATGHFGLSIGKYNIRLSAAILS